MPDDALPPARPSKRRPSRSYLTLAVERRLEVPRAFLDEHHPNNEALQAGLRKGGLTQKLLVALRAALDPAVAADDAQAAAYRDAGAASETLKEAMPAAETAYDEVARRAKAAGRQDRALKAALDVGAKARNRTTRLDQMRKGLAAAETNRAVLEGYGLEAAHLDGARAALATAEQVSGVWERRDREAQDATRLRDGLMPALDTVMQDVQERGRVGLPERPDLLELLGLPPA